ncbi:hypothetical protein CKM354_000794000 [Cercospora kikuchii]|uniref:C2H2-type domain-containing protein n=1 Tax=Cercospora kikuchii TaxID=84275 RepID=A0A9P3CQG0_9PEZI|nr:uncharacterized protein CKM354_000794000 [Cercospora kikuchii]GIZ44750.1 hypothetical protein CKM354_000794000 [Cercospora kikuchii]
MADLGPSISQLTKTCRHELDELSSSHRDAVKRIVHDPLAEPPTALDLLAWIPEQKTKLNLFADLLGVFAHGSLSVEHRLRNNSAVRSSIAQLLEAISKNLCLCIRSRVQLAGPQQTTDDDPIEPAPAYDVTKIACRRIGRDVANLVRFAALIRLRSMQQYRERSEHHEPLDHDGLPLGDYFDKVVTRALKEAFEDTGMAELDDSSQDIQQSVPHRIRQTVTSRWKRICYHIARYQQLRGSDSPAEENVDDEDIVMENVQFDAGVKHAVPLRGDGIHASKNVVVPQHEKATTFQGSLNEQAKVPQPPSITPSVALTNVAGFSVRMPRLRKQDVTYENGMLEFLCPLCKIPQQLPSDRSAVHQHRAWEKHAFYDLEPYICLLECKTPEATYRTFEDWTRHINNEHARYTWQCQNCTESCDNQAAFEQHLRSQHEAKLTAGELAFIAKTCERPVAAFSACFFCGKYELSGQAEAETRDAAALRQRKMMRCMAQHMRSMALTSLPDQLSVSDGSAESAARVSDASEASARFRTVTQSNAKSTNPSSEAFESILSQLKAQYEETDGRAEFTNEWRLKSDLTSSDNRPADLPQLMLDPEKSSQQYWLSTIDLDCVGEGPPRYDGKPLTFDDNEPLSRAVTFPSSYWSVPEQTDFARYIAHFGTDFAAIANHMRTKSQLMVKNHFQRQVDGGRADLAEQAEQANQRRKRGEDMGPPPTPTPISKRKYDTLETIVSHGFPSPTLPMPLDADHPEAALETPRKSTEGSTGVLSAIEDDGYISDEIDPVGKIEVSRGDRMPSDVQDENRFASQTYPGPLQQEGQGGGPSRSMTLPGMDQDSPKSPASNKRHKCPYCATEFARHHNLKSHLLTHSQEKPYVCQTCQARFRRLHDLKRHTKLHIGERPHTCDKCGRKFARGDALERHNKAPGGCAGRRSSFTGLDDDGGAAHNEDLPLYDERPFDVGDKIVVFASNHRYQGGKVIPSSSPPPSPNAEPTAIFRALSENPQPVYDQLTEPSSVQDPFEFFGVKNPRLNAEPTPSRTGRAIHCRSLSIGTWKVVGRTAKDLSVYYWVDEAIIAYFFRGNGMGCKIEYPFAWIKHIMADELFIELIRPPKFYRENTANFTGEFVECSDFTDYKQASQIMTHRLEGHAELLCQELTAMKSLDIYRCRHDNASAAVDSGVSYMYAGTMKRPDDTLWEKDGLSRMKPRQESGVSSQGSRRFDMTARLAHASSEWQDSGTTLPSIRHALGSESLGGFHASTTSTTLPDLVSGAQSYHSRDLPLPVPDPDYSIYGQSAQPSTLTLNESVMVETGGMPSIVGPYRISRVYSTDHYDLVDGPRGMETRQLVGGGRLQVVSDTLPPIRATENAPHTEHSRHDAHEDDEYISHVIDPAEKTNVGTDGYFVGDGKYLSGLREQTVSDDEAFFDRMAGSNQNSQLAQDHPHEPSSVRQWTESLGISDQQVDNVSSSGHPADSSSAALSSRDSLTRLAVGLLQQLQTDPREPSAFLLQTCEQALRASDTTQRDLLITSAADAEALERLRSLIAECLRLLVTPTDQTPLAWRDLLLTVHMVLGISLPTEPPLSWHHSR